jgi:hypothetical protein
MKENRSESSRSPHRLDIHAQWLEENCWPSGFKFLENASSVSGAVRLNTCVYAPVRVLGYSTLSIKGLGFPIHGLKGHGSIFTGLQLSLFRLYVVRNDWPDTLSQTMWLDITLSCDKVGRGIGYSVDLWGSGIEFAETLWICNLLLESGILSSGREIPEPTI